MENVLLEIVTIMTSGITEFGTGIGEGLQSLVNSMFLVQGTDGSELSAFGGIIVVMAGISLAVGLSKLLFTFFTNLGSTRY